MSVRIALVALTGLIAVAPQAHAQETSFVRWHLMGGVNEPVGNTNDLLQTGYNLGFGVTFRQPGEPLGIRLDFNYTSNDASSKLINQGGIVTGLQINGGWLDSWSGTVNLEAQHLFSNAMYGYLIGGIGFYYTSVQLTEQGYGYVCNPWWYYCYPGYGNVVVASHTDNRFGWNAGGGLAFRLRAGPTLLVEARYTQIETSGQSIEMVPITVGIRF